MVFVKVIDIFLFSYYNDCGITYVNFMNKILQATSRGQVTLPKSWRDKYNTVYYTVEIKSDELVLKPMAQNKTLKEEVDNSWQEYKDGKFIGGDDLMKKYGL